MYTINITYILHVYTYTPNISQQPVCAFMFHQYILCIYYVYTRHTLVYATDIACTSCCFQGFVALITHPRNHLRWQRARSTLWSSFWSPLNTGSVGQLHVQYVCWPWWTGKICICASRPGWGSTSMDMPIISYVNVKYEMYIHCIYWLKYFDIQTKYSYIVYIYMLYVLYVKYIR